MTYLNWWFNHCPSKFVSLEVRKWFIAKSFSSTDHILSGFPYVGSLKTIRHDGSAMPNVKIQLCAKLFTDLDNMCNYLTQSTFYTFDEDQIFELSNKLSNIKWVPCSSVHLLQMLGDQNPIWMSGNCFHPAWLNPSTWMALPQGCYMALYTCQLNVNSIYIRRPCKALQRVMSQHGALYYKMKGVLAQVVNCCVYDKD